MGWLWIIGAIVWGAIWGFVAYSIVLNRGYPKEEANKWEFVGFFLGIIGVFIAMVAKPDIRNQQNTTTQQQFNEADTLLKYKELLDSGAITQEEFDAKKKELLKINSNSVASNTIIPDNSWKCPSCGNIQPNYVTTCKCGQEKTIISFPEVN